MRRGCLRSAWISRFGREEEGWAYQFGRKRRFQSALGALDRSFGRLYLILRPGLLTRALASDNGVRLGGLESRLSVAAGSLGSD